MIAPNEHETIRSIRKLICEGVDLYPDDQDGFVVVTPFVFDDGGRFVIILRQDDDGWYVTDDGHTMSRLGVEGVDIQAGQRGTLLESFLRFHGVSHAADGELRVRIHSERVAEGLFGFAQAISEAACLPKFTHDFVRSTFVEDLGNAINDAFPEERVIQDWTDPNTDPDRIYVVDYRVETAGAPLFVYAANNEARASKAIISALHHRQILNGGFLPIAVSEEEAKLPHRLRSQLRDTFARRLESGNDPASLPSRLQSLVGNGAHRT